MSGARGSKALGAYALERLLNAVPLVLGVIVVNFVLVSLALGDPVTALIGEYPAPPDYVERVREQYGLDAPLPERLVRYLGSVVRGDLGFSFANRQPVATLVLERLGRTLLLMVTTVVFATVVGVVLGVWAARRPHSAVDRGATGFRWLRAAAPAHGLTVRKVASIGGSDTNVLNQKGLPTVNVGVGMHDIHSVDEWIDAADLARVAAWVGDALLGR
jgi:ABC-type dipeptide/oligopeptide/nickel transport system permease component